jgi:SAM-dependent methyltransferase
MKSDRWRRRVHINKTLPWPSIEQGEYRSYRAVHPFDERFGVETSGLIYDLPTGHEHDTFNHGYFAVAPSVFHQLLDRLALDYSRFRFVDVGSGKGRALLLASGYPFCEVIGVELSPELNRIAQINISIYLSRCPQPAFLGEAQPARRVRLVQLDAAAFRWPSGPLLIYIWNAFAEPVMDQVLKNLKAALDQESRAIYLIYIHPELEALFDRQDWLERLWLAEIDMSEEDYSAWAFPGRTEVCAVYRAIT